MQELLGREKRQVLVIDRIWRVKRGEEVRVAAVSFPLHHLDYLLECSQPKTKVPKYLTSF